MTEGKMHYFKIYLAALVLCLAAFHPAAAQDAALTPVATHGQLSVAGPHIIDKNKQITSLAGPSFFWSNTGWKQERFYTKGAVETFAKDWNAGIIRVAMGAQGNGSFLEDEAGNIDRVVTVVNAAIKNGLYVIIDWHSHQAEQDIDEAKAFFTAIAKAYGHTPNVIYEIYNDIHPMSFMRFIMNRWTQPIGPRSSNPMPKS